MGQIKFWDNWPQHEKVFYLSLLGLVFLAMSVYFLCYYIGFGAVVEWQTLSYLDSISLRVQDFFVGLFNFNIEGENLLVREYFRGSPLIINLGYSYLFLSILAIAYSILLSTISSLNRFWFVVSMAAVVGILVSFRFDQLLMFGNSDNTFLICIIIAVLSASFIFNAFKTEVRFITRSLVFLGLFIVMAITIQLFSQTEYPFLYLANYGMVGAMVLSIIIVIITAHEIIYLFLYLITKGGTESKHSILHFSVISLLYLGNILLLHLKNANIITFDFLYINAFWLVMISFILGIWGFRKRSLQEGAYLTFAPWGAAFYLAFLLIFLSVTSYVFVTGNDPIQEAYEDLIVFSHLGIGFMFFLYIISNFLMLLVKNYKVYKVAYQPTGMPFFTARFAGFVIVLALFFVSNMSALNKSVAGYYNGLGDIKLYEDKFEVAEQYYNYGAYFAYHNHKSNYALAYLSEWRNDFDKKLEYFKIAVQKNPTAYTYVNLSNAFFDKGKIFDAMFSLRDGLDRFPDHPVIQTNLGRLFEHINVLDSAVIYYGQAVGSSATQNAANTNILALSAQNSLPMNIDSLANGFDKLQYLPLKVNTLAVLNRAERVIDKPFEKEVMPKDSILDAFTAGYLLNHQFNCLHSSISNPEIILPFAYDPSNYTYSEALLKLVAFMYYQKSNYYKAFNGIEALKNNYSDRALKYQSILGKWYMQQGEPKLAVSEYGQMEGEKAFKKQYAIALAESGLNDTSLGIWKHIEDNSDVPNSAPDQTLKALYLNYDEVKDEADEVKFQYIRFNYARLSEEQLNLMANSISNDDLKILALSFLIKKSGGFLKENDEFVEASFSTLKNLSSSEQRIESERKWTIYQSLIKLERYEELKNSFDDDVPSDKVIDAHLVRGAIAEFESKHDEAAGHFKFILDNTAFHELAILKAVAFFRKHSEDEMLVYDRLLKASQKNPYAINIQKEYVLEALDLNLEDYAEEGLSRLGQLVSDKEFQEFKKVYNKKREKNRENRDTW